MKTMRIPSTRRVLAAFVVLSPLLIASMHGQVVIGDLANSSNQADYIIITPPAYVDVLRPLAVFHTQHNGYTSAFALTDSIYAQFGIRISPDSAVKSFMLHALHAWSDPKPRFFLFGGNLNAVPGHRVASELYPFEDSVLLDSWYVLANDGPGTSLRPRAALGRLPAWDALQLESMVTKTLAYRTHPPGSWSARVIALADSDVWPIYEHAADSSQSGAVRVWPDTLTGHLRTTSPRAWSTDQFLRHLGEGAALVTYWGQANNGQIGTPPHFTPGDVQRIASNSPPAFWMLSGAHAFDVPVASSVTLSLLAAEDRGAVAVGVSAGVHYFSSYQEFMFGLVDHITSSSQIPIGILLQTTIQSQLTSEQNFAVRLTLLGDPALIVATPIVAAIDPPGRGEIPLHAALLQNYPNPFNPTTTIRYALPERSAVRLTVFNTLGQRIATLVQGNQGAGYHEVRFDASGLASGVYLYRLQAGDYVQTRKLLLLR